MTSFRSLHVRAENALSLGEKEDVSMKTVIDSSCVFCREQGGSPDTNLARVYPEVTNRSLLTGSSFKVIPCIGQLAPSHCMLIPEFHACRFADLMANHEDEIEELIERFRCMYVRSSNEKLLQFEHGARGSGDGGCGIWHAHLHLVAVPQELNPGTLHKFNNPKRYDVLADALALHTADRPYLLVGTREDGFKAEYCSENLPSQYLRSRLATALGLEVWDWREFGRQDSFLEMIHSNSM